jgi:tRNA threonylcarbamoyladenosine biosynthesis protein TsaE
VTTIRSTEPAETRRLGRRLAGALQPGDVVLMCGSIGAGKSVLARGIVEGFGSSDWKGSPTFTLVNEYPTDPPLFHVDLYRLSEAEAEAIGLEEYVRDDSITIVEWADRAPAYLGGLAGRPPIEIEIEIEDRGGSGRVITIPVRLESSPLHCVPTDSA